jgi:hypothetical protein
MNGAGGGGAGSWQQIGTMKASGIARIGGVAHVRTTSVVILPSNLHSTLSEMARVSHAFRTPHPAPRTPHPAPPCTRRPAFATRCPPPSSLRSLQKIERSDTYSARAGLEGARCHGDVSKRLEHGLANGLGHLRHHRREGTNCKNARDHNKTDLPHARGGGATAGVVAKAQPANKAGGGAARAPSLGQQKRWTTRSR